MKTKIKGTGPAISSGPQCPRHPAGPPSNPGISPSRPSSHAVSGAGRPSIPKCHHPTEPICSSMRRSPRNPAFCRRASPPHAVRRAGGRASGKRDSVAAWVRAREPSRCHHGVLSDTPVVRHLRRTGQSGPRGGVGGMEWGNVLLLLGTGHLECTRAAAHRGRSSRRLWPSSRVREAGHRHRASPVAASVESQPALRVFCEPSLLSFAGAE